MAAMVLAPTPWGKGKKAIDGIEILAKGTRAYYEISGGFRVTVTAEEIISINRGFGAAR
ncbi:hypothetical protein GCM10020221_15550 [Streptomyces thioluteus]|uniref:Uncharacterized protein n=1 Tax=Streptomyces thioluteus TaxID=66431 RepID=A0ABN3WM64_STRTU